MLLLSPTVQVAIPEARFTINISVQISICHLIFLHFKKNLQAIKSRPNKHPLNLNLDTTRRIYPKRQHALSPQQLPPQKATSEKLKDTNLPGFPAPVPQTSVFLTYPVP
jgi:hypothetical protein